MSVAGNLTILGELAVLSADDSNSFESMIVVQGCAELSGQLNISISKSSASRNVTVMEYGCRVGNFSSIVATVTNSTCLASATPQYAESQLSVYIQLNGVGCSDTMLPADDSMPLWIILVIAAIALLLIIAIVSAALLIRRRNRRLKDSLKEVEMTSKRNEEANSTASRQPPLPPSATTSLPPPQMASNPPTSSFGPSPSSAYMPTVTASAYPPPPPAPTRVPPGPPPGPPPSYM